MPWHIEDNHESCQGFAVVKDEDGELEGCHRNRDQAERQLAALNASEQNDNFQEDNIGDNNLGLQNERAGEPEPMPRRAIVEEILANLRNR